MSSKYQHIAIAMVLSIESVGCRRNVEAPTPPAEPAGESDRSIEEDPATSAPFEYSIISKVESIHTYGPQIVVVLETTNEVARTYPKTSLSNSMVHPR